jgi:predicted nucleotidyltransferase/predicted XRE-type DNA-binding protein
MDSLVRAEQPAAALKKVLAGAIIGSLDRNGLSVREAQARTRIAAADFSRLRNGRLDRFTIDRLLDIAARLGERVEVSVKATPAADAPPIPALLARRRKEIGTLCRRFSVEHLAAFGSVLREDFDPKSSDIDLAVTFGKSARYSPANQYFEFKSAMETLLDRAIDLVERSAMRDSRLKRTIERTQVSIYGKAG